MFQQIKKPNQKSENDVESEQKIISFVGEPLTDCGAAMALRSGEEFTVADFDRDYVKQIGKPLPLAPEMAAVETVKVNSMHICMHLIWDLCM